MNPELKVIPSKRPTMFLWLRQIFVTSEFLAVTSNECLQSAIWHEYGHVQQRMTMLALVSVSVSIIFLSMLIFELELFIFLLVGFYLWCCFLSRLGEYGADSFALRNTTKEGVKELLIGEGSRLDSKLSMLFYPLRFHPSAERRLKILGLKL